jgi:hypothetical protein
MRIKQENDSSDIEEPAGEAAVGAFMAERFDGCPSDCGGLGASSVKGVGLEPLTISQIPSESSKTATGNAAKERSATPTRA